VPDAAVHNMRTISYPFLMGLFRRIGWRASWRVIGVRYASDLLYELTPEDLGLLGAEARRLKPRVVILNQRLPKKQLAAVRAAAPGARLVYWSLTEDLYALAAHVRRRVPEARGPALKDPRLLERIRPAYRRKVLNRAPWAADPSPGIKTPASNTALKPNRCGLNFLINEVGILETTVIKPIPNVTQIKWRLTK